MRHYFLYFLSFYLFGITSCISYVSANLDLPISNEELNRCQPAGSLLELLSLLDVEHENTMPSIIQATQDKWLRKKGTERWEIASLYEDKRNEITPLLMRMNLVQEINPHDKHYAYAIILGATLSSVRERIEFMLRQWEQGIRFEQIVFLGGARLLYEKTEPQNLIIYPSATLPRLKKSWQFQGELPKTETDMMKIIFSQVELPVGMEKLKVIFVDASAKKAAAGKLVRPNTGDTVLAWLQLKPISGSVLAISSQPFVAYQDAVLKALLPATFSIDTVGKEAPENLAVGVHLDNLSRLLYQKCSRYHD